MPPNLEGATVTLIGLTCPPHERRNWLHLYPEAGVLHGECEWKAFGRIVDREGQLGEETSRSWGVPGLGQYDSPTRFRSIGGRVWLAVFDITDDAGSTTHDKTVFQVKEPSGWRFVAETRRSQAVGLGPWPGGAVIAALRKMANTSRPWFQVLDGTPTAPMPEVPHEVSHADFATTEEGEVFGARDVDQHPADDLAVLAHWPPGHAQPQIESFPGFVLSYHMSNQARVLGAAGGVYVAIVSDASGVERFARVMRFDGAGWRPSATFADVTEVEAMVVTPDRALWMVISAGYRGFNRSEIWRRAPEEEDRWAQVVPDVVSRTTTLVAKELMPAGERDVLFTGELEGVGTGLYRIHLPDVDER